MAEIDRSRLARNDREYHDLLASEADWLARTAEDVKRLRVSRRSPLSKLSHEAFTDFLDNLVFHGGGMVAASYKPLMSLPLTQIFEVFEGFGISRQFLAEEPKQKEDCEDCGSERGGCDVHLECRMIAPGVCEFDFWSYCISPPTW
ncbi:hypothetical protein [Streptomyces xanthophaeus]